MSVHFFFISVVLRIVLRRSNPIQSLKIIVILPFGPDNVVKHLLHKLIQIHCPVPRKKRRTILLQILLNLLQIEFLSKTRMGPLLGWLPINCITWNILNDNNPDFILHHKKQDENVWVIKNCDLFIIRHSVFKNYQKGLIWQRFNLIHIVVILACLGAKIQIRHILKYVNLRTKRLLSQKLY